jgi:pimeloyl-ACP methyl ester carboxylesterase
MDTTSSLDGTPIAFERTGTGAPVILVDGALCYRASGPGRPLARELSRQFTVYTYDRRGRGESGDTAPYAVQREVEDIAALIEEAGGSASLCGVSSGATLALEAAGHGLPVDKLAIYEAPFIVDDSRPPIPEDYQARLTELLAADRRSDAVKLFMKIVGVPGLFLAVMPLLPAWGKLKGVAHTLVYDAAIMEGTQAGRPLPAKRWMSIDAPTLIADGGKSPAWMHSASEALLDVLPRARRQTLPGQTHIVKAKALGPVLSAFFAA